MNAEKLVADGSKLLELIIINFIFNSHSLFDFYAFLLNGQLKELLSFQTNDNLPFFV